MAAQPGETMQRIILGPFVCLLLTACTIGIGPLPSDMATEVASCKAMVTRLQVTPSSTFTPTPTRTPTPTPTPPKSNVPPPAILSFAVNPTEISPDEPVTLTWATTGTVYTSLRRTTALGYGSLEQDIPFSGTLVMGSNGAGRHWHDYELIAYNSAGITVTRSLTVHFHCPDKFFFNTTSRLCPNGPAQPSWAAEQVFEGGYMIWLQDGFLVGKAYEGRSAIFVLYTQTSSWELQADTWNQGEPDRDPFIVPPEGLYQPIRGFGKLWRNDPQMRERLGWAKADEQGFGTLYQRVSDFDYDNQCHYLRAADNRVISLCSRGGLWSLVTP